MSRLWAVARMTLLEALRRKVFLILLIFGVALVSGTLFFPAINEEARLRLLQAWSLRAATLFSAIVGLFLAGFSIPSDIEQKRVYMLVTKPLPKPFLFLGRLLGFSMLVALFITASALISTTLMRVVAAAGGPGFPRPVARPCLKPDEFGASRGQPVDGLPGLVALHHPESYLAWRFPARGPGAFDGPIRGQIRLFIGSPTDKYRADGRVRILARGPGGTRQLPDLLLNTNEEKEIELPAEIVGGGGRIEVRALAVDPDGMIAGDATRLVLFERPALFELAYLGGMVLVFLQSLTVLALTLAASTLVSGPLAVLLGILLYLVGSIYGYMVEATRGLDRSLEVEQLRGVKSGTVRDLPTPVVRIANAISKAVLKVVPDYDRFDYGRWLMKDTTVSWTETRAAAAHALPMLALCLAGGILVMLWRDLGG